jgi:hypothetical protein
MNTALRESIVRHILSNFAIIPSSFVHLDKTKSLMDKDFLLDEKISFVAEDGSMIKNKIWGCQISAESQEVKILLGDCSQDKYIPEYCLLVSLKDLPSYGVYLISAPSLDGEALIACTLDGKEWLECQTYLQATFLAGMEQIREIGSNWTRCANYKEQYQALLSFVKFRHRVYEAKYV